MTETRTSPSGRRLSATLFAFGSQPAWFIDATNGKDNNPGTSTLPLKTMAEFNSRLSYNTIRQVTTLTLVGDVIDSPLQLSATTFVSGATLTIAGTVTTIATDTISVVTVLNTTTTFQLTTTNIVWSAANVGQRLQLQTGQFGVVQEFVDANNIVTGPFVNINGAAVVPSAGQTLQVQTLSAALAPIANGLQASIVGFGVGTSAPLTIRDVSLSVSAALGLLQTTGLSMTLFGCKLTFSVATFYTSSLVSIVGCCVTSTASFLQWRGNGQFLGNTWIGGTLVAGASATLSFGLNSWSSFSLQCTERSYVRGTADMHWRNTAAPVFIATGALLFTTGIFSGAIGNSGVGIQVRASAGFSWSNNRKPTVTGASDTKVGNTARTYAQLGTNGYVDLNLDAIPPTTTILVSAGVATAGTPAFMVLEV